MNYDQQNLREGDIERREGRSKWSSGDDRQKEGKEVGGYN